MRIDINADVGEGMQNEHLLMPYLSSCNIACGGHFGTEETISETVKIAKSNNVKVGAHPSFPDIKNFGRELLDISPKDLIESIQNQIALFLNVASKHQLKMNHIKAHGALYNTIAIDEYLAAIYLTAIANYVQDCFLFVPYNSVIAKKAIEKNINIKYEVFADRNYNNDYSLVSRKLDNALITDEKQVLEHVLFMVNYKKVKTINHKEIPIKADTFCIHGDTKNAAQTLEYLVEELQQKGIYIDK